MPDGVVHLDELGDGMFRKVRAALGVEAFGVNALVLPPGHDARPHVHDVQDELYFVHAGTPEMRIGDETVPLRPGSFVHVRAATPRVVRNPGTETAVVVVVGGHGGYVGRDGRLADV